MRATGIVVVVALFVLPFVTTAFLARRRSRSLALAA
jgi:ABC-type Mn2+/Zn2+ transport system permease subunit